MKRFVLPLLALNALLCGARVAVADDAPPATSPYTQALETAGRRAEAKDFDGARQAFDKAFQLAATPVEKSDVLLALGGLYGSEGNPAQARVQWRKVLALPGVTATRKRGVHFLIAVSLLPKQTEPARRELQVVLGDKDATSDERFAASYQIADTYLTEGAYARARLEFEKLLPLQADHPESVMMVRVRIADLHGREGHYDQAIKMFSALAATKPDDSLPIDVQQQMNGSAFLARSGLAGIYLQQKDYVHAKEEYTKIRDSDIQDELKEEARKRLQEIDAAQR